MSTMRNQKCVKSFTLFHTFILYDPLKRKIVHNLSWDWDGGHSERFNKVLKSLLLFNDFLRIEICSVILKIQFMRIQIWKFSWKMTEKNAYLIVNFHMKEYPLLSAVNANNKSQWLQECMLKERTRRRWRM